MTAIRSTRALLALAALLAALAATALPASAPARPARSHGAGCTTSHRTASHRRAAKKTCPKHASRRKGDAPKRTTHHPKRPASTPPPAPRLVPAECEDGSAPVSSNGSFACEDGSQPACEDGSAPTATAASGMPMCAVEAEEEGENCSHEAAAAEECPLVEWTCEQQREGSAAPQPCEAEAGEQPSGDERD